MLELGSELSRHWMLISLRALGRSPVAFLLLRGIVRIPKRRQIVGYSVTGVGRLDLPVPSGRLLSPRIVQETVFPAIGN